VTDTSVATELPAPPAKLVLKKIAVGHGIQNYTCQSTTSDIKATGAVAVLYDVTTLYPGTAKTGLGQGVWDKLPSTLLWNTPLPLNKLAGSKYGADSVKPFPKAESLKVQGLPDLKFLGHHFFDANSVPMFDLSAAGLKASVVKTGDAKAPANADKGIIGTGAVAWLQLGESGLGLSNGLSLVYRVITAGGAAQTCAEVNGATQSVPYATFYWFYG
jgi:hypothetical protein